MVINLKMEISCLKHGYKPTNDKPKMKISCLKHGYKAKNENKLFKTWL